jgi:hypothetical protein
MKGQPSRSRQIDKSNLLIAAEGTGPHPIRHHFAPEPMTQPGRFFSKAIRRLVETRAEGEGEMTLKAPVEHDN